MCVNMKKTAWEIFNEISPSYYNYENSNRQNAFFYTKDIENVGVEFGYEKTHLLYEGDGIKWEDEFDFDNCHVDEESKSIIFTDKCNNILTVGKIIASEQKNELQNLNQRLKK